MAGEFQSLHLGTVCSKVGSGATPRGGKEAYRGGATSLIRSQNIYNDRFVHDGLAFIDNDQANELRNVVVEDGDVLLNITGDSVARCCQVDPAVLPARVNQHVAIIRPKAEILDARFLRYSLVSPTMQARLLALASAGATRNALTKGMLEALEITAPLLPEQRAIAHILGTLDDKIELNRSRNQTLEAMARALFKDWFVDFGPVRAKMEGREPCLPADIRQLFPDRLDDEGKPEGWELIPVNGLASLETSSISPSKSPEAVFEHYSIPAFDAGGMPAMELGESIKSNKYKVHADAVLVSKLNPQTPRIWLPTVETDHAVCSTEFMQFVPRTRDDRPFLYCLMVSEVMQAEVLRHVTGSTGSRQRAQPSQIAKVEVLLPEPNILSAFNCKAEPLLRAIADNQLESQTLTKLRDTLLPKLISGELRIKDADKFLERVA